jgi:arginine deiminase
MQNRNLLIIEDNAQDVVSILQFLGGDDFGASISRVFPDFVDEFPNPITFAELVLPPAPSGPLGTALLHILGNHASVRVVAIGKKLESDKFLADASNVNDTVLAVLDLSIPGGELFEIEKGKPEEPIAFSLFERLLALHVPVFVLSDFLNPVVFAKLQQIANGRFFGFYHKGTFLDSIERSEKAQQSEANFIASLVLTKPFYNILLHLKSDFKQDFPGSGLIASEVSRLLYEGTQEHTRGEIAESQEQLDSIISELRSGATAPELGVVDEVSTLRAVLIHEPGLETELVNAKNCEDLLFNQPIQADRFVRQYRQFRAVIEGIAKVYRTRVYTVRELLSELLDNEKYGQFLRSKLIIEMLKGSGSPEKFWKLLDLPTGQLIEIAIAGTTREQVDNEHFLEPIANFMFTRDWGFTVHETVFLSNMNKTARLREKAIARFIFEFHPLFRQLFDNDLSALETGTIEGGDVMLASARIVLVGLSERTDFEAILEFSERVFARSATVETIIATPAPREHPKSMHLDTFIGFLDRDTVLMYDDILVKKRNPQFIFRRDQDVQLKVNTFEKVLQDEMSKEGIILNTISVSEKNEQYDDACNIFAVSPGKALIYERVPKTIEKIRGAGWAVQEFDFSLDERGRTILTEESDARLQKLLADEGSKVLIKVPGDELSLARGGPHCMTFPLSRERK